MSEPVFIERRVIVAQYEVPQRDEPPGRGCVGERETVLRSVEAVILPQDVQAHVAALDKGLPRRSLSEPSPLVGDDARFAAERERGGI